MLKRNEDQLAIPVLTKSKVMLFKQILIQMNYTPFCLLIITSTSSAKTKHSPWDILRNEKQQNSNNIKPNDNTPELT